MPSPTPLYQIEECPDLYVDACMCDEQRNLVFLSTWGRDTVTQELLARLWAGKRVARQNFSGQTPKNLSFTPRARVGRDSRFTNTVITGDGFQSTHPCGARPWIDGVQGMPELFQSTRPCGARPSTAASSTSASCFNPRAGAGRDCRRWPARWPRMRFNPRARAGRDLCSACRARPWWCFNPRARAGRDAKVYGVLSVSWAFQSTRPCGARP